MSNYNYDSDTDISSSWLYYEKGVVFGTWHNVETLEYLGRPVSLLALYIRHCNSCG